MLSAVMSMAICSLFAGLSEDNASDYVFACYFLICTVTFLKIRCVFVRWGEILLPNSTHGWMDAPPGPPY